MTSLAIADRTINVPFHGNSLLVVEHQGEAYTPMKPIVEGMGLAWQTQHRKLRERFSKGITEMMIPSVGGSQSMTCLALRKLNGWLQTISPNKVKPEIRDRVIQYQEECDDVLYEYWTKGEVTNPRKAKKCIAGKITPDQQEAIKQLVMTRGKALPKDKQAKAMITMWSALKSHFGVTYKEIQEDQFSEALSLAARVPLEGELLPRQDNEVFTINREQAMSICHLLCHVYWVEQRWQNGIGAGLKEMGSPLYGQTHEHVIHMARFGRILDRELAPMLKQFEHLSGKRLQQLQS